MAICQLPSRFVLAGMTQSRKLRKPHKSDISFMCLTIWVEYRSMESRIHPSHELLAPQISWWSSTKISFRHSIVGELAHMNVMFYTEAVGRLTALSHYYPHFETKPKASKVVALIHIIWIRLNLVIVIPQLRAINGSCILISVMSSFVVVPIIDGLIHTFRFPRDSSVCHF